MLTVAPLRKGLLVQLEVNLPSLNEKHDGLSLRTRGKVIRAEEKGFAAVADMGFRIQLPAAQTLKQTVGKSRKNGRYRHESSTEGANLRQTELASRSSM